MELQAANALYRITKNKDQIVANNLEASIQAASVDGELYGYPVASTTFVSKEFEYDDGKRAAEGCYEFFYGY